MENEIPHSYDAINNNSVKDSIAIESQMLNLMMTEEGQKIKTNIELLQDMGYDKKMINKIYILFQPENINRAIDYMTEINGIYHHHFFENYNSNKDKNICFICKKNKIFHFDYIPNEEFYSNNGYSINNNMINEINNNFNNEVNNNINNNFNFSNLNSLSNNISFNYSNNEDISDQNKRNKSPFECKVCYEGIEENEKQSNMLPCGHFCCKQCWINYFKTLISEGTVEEIKCIDFSCNNIIEEEFILKHIKEDQTLIEKYNKFKIRAEILKDENKRPCPFPDCESFLEKSKSTKYIKCKNGHEYCFECLKPPHGKIKCQNLDKKFLNWTKNKRVKKCPKCGIYIEKNEGCNHMKCNNCKYDWCWLCEGPNTYDHYSSGKCKGHQYTRADNLKQANICCFTIRSLFPFFYPEIIGVFPLNSMLLRYLAIFGMWFFGFFFFVGFSMYNFTNEKIKKLYCSEKPYYIAGVLIALFLFICFQLLFSILLTPFIFISLFNPNFFDIILFFLNIGD